MKDIIQKFLWYSATSNRDILEKCPTEQSKHALIGTLVLLTAVFAFISGSFAMNYMFEMDPNGHYYALGFGFLWAIMIFSLDRLLISTIRKDTGMPGKNYSKNRQWALVFLRIALAVVISVVITKPLELWLYEDQINAQIVDNVRDKNDRDEGSITTQMGINTISTQKETAEDQVESFSFLLEHAEEDTIYVNLRGEFETAKANYESFNSKKDRDISNKKSEIRRINDYKVDKYIHTEEIFLANGDFTYKNTINSSGRSRVRQLKKDIDNLRYQAKIKKDKYQQLDTESTTFLTNLKDSLSSELSATRGEQRQLTNKLASNLKNKTVVMDSLKRINNAADRGIFGRIDILHQYNQSSSTRRMAGWFIFMIFLIIETAPIIAKSVSKVGPYDYALAALEYKKEKHEEQRKQLIDLTLQAQAEVAKRALSIWKQEQIQMIEDDPYSFVKELKKRSRTRRS